MNTTVTSATANYLAQIRAELGDLPPAELEEVLEDVAGHLEEISAELDGEPSVAALHARLGTPGQYADELRTAAGYPPRRSATDSGTFPLALGAVAAVLTPFLVLVWFGFDWYHTPAVFFFLAIGLAPAALGVRALRGRDPRIVTTTPSWRRAEGWLRPRVADLPEPVRRDLVPIGQPVWWVLRGVLGGIAVYGVLAPAVDAFALLLVCGAGALGSIWLGRRSQQDRRLLWFLVPLNLVAVFALLVLVIGGSAAWHGNDNSYSGMHDAQPYTPGLSIDGSPVNNLFLYDRDGRPLTDVRVYDQLGRPVTQSTSCNPANPNAPVVTNLWPSRHILLNDSCLAVAPPRPSVAPLTPTPTPTTPPVTSQPPTPRASATSAPQTTR